MISFRANAGGLKGLTRYLVFFVIEVATRKVEIVGIHADPCEQQMLQWARNLTDAEDGFLKDKRILIHDRDPLYTKKFRETLRAAGVRSLKLPKRAPNLNPHAERYVLSIKSECLNKMIIFGERHLRYVVEQYNSHYLRERPHRVLGRRSSNPRHRCPSKARSSAVSAWAGCSRRTTARRRDSATEAPLVYQQALIR